MIYVSLLLLLMAVALLVYTKAQRQPLTAPPGTVVEPSDRSPFRPQVCKCANCKAKSVVGEEDLSFATRLMFDKGFYAEWTCSDCKYKYNKVDITFWQKERIDQRRSTT